jgi:hypothetical protein
VKQLEAEMKKLTDVASQPLKGGLLDPKTAAALKAHGHSLDGLTDKYTRDAKAMRAAGTMSMAYYENLVDDIQKMEKAYKKGNKTQKAALSAQLAETYRYAQGYASIHNQMHEDVRKGERKHQDLWSRIIYAADTDRINEEKRTHRESERNLAAHHRSVRGAWRRASQIPGRMMNGIAGSSSIAYTGLGAAAAGGRAAQSAISQRMQIDTAETNLQMFGGLSKEDARKVRGEFGDNAAVKYGISPSQALDAYTESLKAGITTNTKEITDQILKSATGLDISPEETTKLVGRAASLFNDIKEVDPKRIKSMLNAIGVANRDSAADGNEIVAANRRGTGVLATSKMTMEQLSAFNAANISGGMQSGKSGTFMGFLVNDLVNAGKTRGQRGKDLGKFSSMLGFGGKASLAAQATADPTKTIQTILERLAKMPEGKRAEAMNLLGMREWRDELAILVQERGKLKQILEAINDPKNANFLDEASVKRLTSLNGKWKSFKSALSLFWSSIGEGFDELFIDFTDFFKDFFAQFDKENLKSAIKRALDGVREGLGFSSWREMFASVFGNPGESKLNPDKFFAFAKGFAEGIKVVANTVGGVLSTAASLFGFGPGLEGLGKFTAELIGFSIALMMLRPVIGIFIVLKELFVGMGLIFAGIKGLFSWASKDAMAEVTTSMAKNLSRALGRGVIIGIATLFGEKLMDVLFSWLPGSNPEMGKKLQDRSTWQKMKDLFTSSDELKKRYGVDEQPKAQKQSFIENGTEAGKAFKKVAFEGNNKDLLQTAGLRQELEDLNGSFKKYGGQVMLASLTSSKGGITDFSASRRGGGGGGGGGGDTTVASSGSPSPTDLFTSTPGGKLPNFGMGSRGIIGGGNDVGTALSGSMNKGAYEKIFAGTPMAGMYDQVVDAAKTNNIDPALLAGIMAHESGKGSALSGNNPGGIMDPATNWSKKKQFGSLAEGINSTASTVAKNWNRAGGNLSSMAGIYAPQGAANDPRGLNKNWLGGVQGFMGQLGGGSSAVGGSAPNGLADQLGVRGGANFMKGQYGAPGENQTTITTASGKKMTVNSAAAESFKGFVDELEGSGYKINSLGGFSMRGKRGGGGWSQHAYGNAIDINPDKNPMTGKLITDMPPNVRDMAAKYGLSWGGDWKSTKDAMHFEWMGKKPWKDNPNMIGGVPPSGKEAIKSVPDRGPEQTRADLGGGNSGQVAIHINGSNHDPESLATLVQRRVSESMNWRTHDVEHEMV